MRTKSILTAMTLLCLPAIARANDWSELRADASGSRASAERSGGTSFVPAWTYKLKQGGPVISTPVTADGLVVTAGTKGDVAAVGLKDGHERWAQVLDGGVGSTPAIRNGRLITSTLGGQLTSLDLASGAINWQRPFGGGMNYSSPTIVDDPSGGPGTVILPAGFPSQDVSRIDLATGAAAWCTSKGAIEGLVYTSAAVVGQQAIIGMNTGRYQSLDLASGATRWTFNTVGPVGFSSPLVVGDVVYMFPGDAASQLFAAKVDTGQPVSGFPLSIPDPAPVAGSNGTLGQGPAPSPPMTAGGLIIFQMRRQDMLDNADHRTFRVAMREYVVAVDPRQMKVVWQHPLANVVALNVNGVPELNTCATPAAFVGPNGPVLAVSSSISPLLAVLDVATGEERWSAPLAAPGRSSPIFSNGLLLVGTDVGTLHAFSSSANHAPAAPSSVVVADTTASSVTLGWTAANDPEGDALSYEVRVADGNVVTESATAAGQTTVTIAATPGASYRVSMRARDAMGAVSDWSASVLVQMSSAPSLVAVEEGPPAPTPADMLPLPLPLPTMTSCAPPPPTMFAPLPPPPARPAGPAPMPPAGPAPMQANGAATTQPAGPIVTVFPDAPSQASIAAVAPMPTPAEAFVAPVATSPMPPALEAVMGLTHAAATDNADTNDGLAPRGNALASGCSVAGAGSNSGPVALSGVALALLSIMRRSRKRAPRRG